MKFKYTIVFVFISVCCLTLVLACDGRVKIEVANHSSSDLHNVEITVSEKKIYMNSVKSESLSSVFFRPNTSSSYVISFQTDDGTAYRYELGGYVETNYCGRSYIEIDQNYMAKLTEKYSICLGTVMNP